MYARSEHDSYKRRRCVLSINEQGDNHELSLMDYSRTVASVLLLNRPFLDEIDLEGFFPEL